jgi:hypothetical protein
VLLDFCSLVALRLRFSARLHHRGQRRSIADFERIHRTELSCLPLARVQSSFALGEVINRAVPPAALAADNA